MTTAQEFVEQVAELEGSERLAEGVKKGVGALEQESLDPTLFQDDALAWFQYGGSEERNEQVDFLTDIRNQLATRYTDIEGLGHSVSSLSIVGIDKLLKLLDGLLQIREVGKIRQALTGPCQKLCRPDSLLPEISRKFGDTMDAAQQIADAVTSRNFGGMRDRLDLFDSRRNALQTDIGNVNHPLLRQHLTQWMLVPPNRFAGGSVYEDARSAADRQVTGDFRNHWEQAKKAAEKQFETLTKARGKKMKLDAVIKFDKGFGPAVKKLEAAKKKGNDLEPSRAEALAAATAYLKAVENLPDKLKNATPDFVTPLHKTLIGLIASIQDFA